MARIDGTRVRALADGDIDSAPSWSPNGKRLVINDEGNIYVLNVSSGRSTNVIHDHRQVYHPNFSGDGQQILFTRKWRGNLALWTVSTQGGSATVLFRNPRRAAFGTYSPDGESIAFRQASLGDGSDGWEMTSADVWIADSDGSDAHRLIVGGSSMSQVDPNALWPMWSPDGTRIAYESLNGGGVYVHDLGTGRTSDITEGTKPSWLDNTTLIVETLEPGAHQP